MGTVFEDKDVERGRKKGKNEKLTESSACDVCCVATRGQWGAVQRICRRSGFYGQAQESWLIFHTWAGRLQEGHKGPVRCFLGV